MFLVLCVLCADLTSFHPMQVIIRANPFSLFHEAHRHDHVLFWPPWNNLHLGPDEVDLNLASHRAQVSYGRMPMFFQSKIRVDADSTEEVSLAYVEEYWEYAKNRHCSMVGSGNVQLYAPGRQELSTAAGDVQVCLGLVREMADLDVDVSVGGGDPDAIETVLQDLTADDGEHAAATDLSPGLAAAATEFDDNQSAFGGPEAGFLEGLGRE